VRLLQQVEIGLAVLGIDQEAVHVNLFETVSSSIL
jgi:hypothetical protein